MWTKYLGFVLKKKIYDKKCKQKTVQSLELKAAFYPDF